jgi:hypothetical protein
MGATCEAVMNRHTAEAARAGAAASPPTPPAWPSLPFDVCRAIEEQEGGGEPSRWTEARDQALWAELHG